MKEEGIDLSGKKSQSVFELFKAGKLYSYVITVCDEADAMCPVFPGLTHRLHTPFPDPSSFDGSPAENLEKTRQVREAVKQTVKAFIDDPEQFLARASSEGFGR